MMQLHQRKKLTFYWYITLIYEIFRLLGICSEESKNMVYLSDILYFDFIKIEDWKDIGLDFIQVR